MTACMLSRKRAAYDSGLSGLASLNVSRCRQLTDVSGLSGLSALRAFPADARRDAGFELRRVQQGLDPDDWKPMRSIGPGVREIRIRQASGADHDRRRC